VDRYLVVLLGLVAVAGLLIAVPLGADNPPSSARLETLPAEAGNWRSVDRPSTFAISSDPRASESLERTYTDGSSTVWLSVTRYPSRNDPRTRPAFHKIVPTRGVAVYDSVRVDLNGVAGNPMALNRVSIRQEGRASSVVYWYQVERKIITGEYDLRLRLFLDTLLARNRSVVLVRVVTSNPQALEPFLRVSFPHLIRL
jgi:EpsI family protein